MEKFKKYIWMLLTALGSILAFILLKPNNKKRHDKKENKKAIKETDETLAILRKHEKQFRNRQGVIKTNIKTSKDEIKDLENTKSKIDNTNTDVDKATNHLNNL